jgi:hypothetical protein
MFAILASLVFAGAGTAAMAVIVLTVQAQSAAVRQVIADSRAIARDREFLVRLIGEGGSEDALGMPIAVSRLRPAPQQAFSRRVVAPVLQSAFQPALQREAA